MADYAIRDTLYYISKTLESSLNTDVSAGANFLRVATQQPAYVLPNIEYRDDAGKPGNGHEFATLRCAQYVTHPALSITDDVNVAHAGRLAIRALGGSVTTAQQAATAAYKHTAKMLDALTSRQLPSMTGIVLEGPASFRLAGGVVDRFRMSQQRADPPIFQADILFSGKFTTPHGVTSLPSSIATLDCLSGHDSVVSWTDTGGAQSFGASSGIRSWSVEIANNTKLNDRIQGDSKISITDSGTSLTQTQAAYVGRMRHGDRVITAQLVVVLGSDLADWLTHITNDTLTDVTFMAVGSLIASTYYNSLGIILPKARIASIEPTEDDGDAAYTVNLIAFWDSSTSTAARVEVINTETSAYA